MTNWFLRKWIFWYWLLFYGFCAGIIDQDQGLGQDQGQDQVHTVLEEENEVLILCQVKRILRRPKQRRRKWIKKLGRTNRISKHNKIYLLNKNGRKLIRLILTLPVLWIPNLIQKNYFDFRKGTFYSDIVFGESEVSSERLQQRAARFRESLDTPKSGKKIITVASSISVYEDTDGDFDYNDLHIVGTCQDLEKPFLRLTSVSITHLPVNF